MAVKKVTLTLKSGAQVVFWTKAEAWKVATFNDGTLRNMDWESVPGYASLTYIVHTEVAAVATEDGVA